MTSDNTDVIAANCTMATFWTKCENVFKNKARMTLSRRNSLHIHIATMHVRFRTQVIDIDNDIKCMCSPI